MSEEKRKVELDFINTMPLWMIAGSLIAISYSIAQIADAQVRAHPKPPGVSK